MRETIHKISYIARQVIAAPALVVGYSVWVYGTS